MCGLAGRFGASGLNPAPGWRARADARLAHRGPDEAGAYNDAYCELVHRRLALIDLTPTGRQPMMNKDASVVVVYNGEIYNHRELRHRLQRRGHTFRGTSDTEVLVHLYEEEGEAMVGRLRGIFAFAIYDRLQRQLLLARDRYGVKPLFYAEHDGALVFASEMKAIAALDGFRGELDRQACYDFLGLGYVPEPATGFANIAALPPGHLITASPAGRRLRQYARVAAEPNDERGLGEAADALARRLPDAVASQSVADVPVAALLSGGIDSSLVVAAHRHADAAPPLTFSVRFPDRAHDETDVALAVHRHCGTTHHVIDLEDWAITPEAIMGLARHFDQPFADTSLIPMYWIARAVRERGIICTLSGDGGDEVFGGYSMFWRADRLMRLMALPDWACRAASGAGRLLAGSTRDWGRQASKALALAADGRDDAARVIAGLTNYLNEDEKAELVAPELAEPLLPVSRHFAIDGPAAAHDIEDLSSRLTAAMFAVKLPSQMLRKVDMMSMRASIEVRVPLLDEGIVALGLTLPHRLKTDGRQGKLVPRALAQRWLPPRVARHPKHGFTIPLDVMVPAGFHAALDDLLMGPEARTRTFVNRALLGGWLAAFRRAAQGQQGGAISRGGLYQRVFTIFALELWMREYGLAW